jgi:hypothetical protein
MPQHPTNAVEIFLNMAEAVEAGLVMTPRSENDKEFFAQDWFEQRLLQLGFARSPQQPARRARTGGQPAGAALPPKHYAIQGRNSYPDFLVTDAALSEGFEIKSLAFTNNRPARSDIDFNSTIPSGRKGGREVFLAFSLYAESGINPRSVHSISLAHGDLINSDHGLSDEHLNVGIARFGSYGDGAIRNRRMYRFPHPISIDPGGLGKVQFIVPQEWQIQDPRLRHVKTLSRTVAADSVDSYTIRLRGRGQADVNRTPAANR